MRICDYSSFEIYVILDHQLFIFGVRNAVITVKYDSMKENEIDYTNASNELMSVGKKVFQQLDLIAIQNHLFIILKLF